MSEEKDIAVRAYICPEGGWSSSTSIVDEPDFNRIVVLDTETTTDERQSLKFGTAVLVIHGQVKFGWIFYQPKNIKPSELDELKRKAEEHRFNLMELDDYLEKVFLPEVYDNKTPCVGFNLPFDLSRLAKNCGPAKGWNRGGFSFTLSEDYPRLVIRHMDRHRSTIHFGKGRYKKRSQYNREKASRKFRGHFLDLHTAAFALTGDGLSLNEACKRFTVKGSKSEVKEHGKITSDYVEYNINDVRITCELFKKVMQEYEGYHLDMPITGLSSPASIGKAYLKAMGVRSFLEQNPDFPPELLGEIMETYFGGRAEVRKRLQPTRIRLLDFLSMYPTMCGVLKMWNHTIADHIDFYDDTEEVRKFVENVTLDDLKNAETWRELNAICTIQPDGDVLFVRSDFDEVNYNLGTEYGNSSIPLRYTLADVVASKLLTGKSPRILRAIRLVPVGVQEGLSSITIKGDKTLDPTKQDFFMALAEHRNEFKKTRDAIDKEYEPGRFAFYDSCQNAVKITLNATSYGIFIEENVIPQSKDVMVYGAGKSFKAELNKYEQPGPFFNPITATFVTAAARLVLAITEAILSRHGAVYAFCDTDSMAVPPEHVDDIQAFFRGLSPYPFKAELFKLEKYNYEGNDEKKDTLVDLMFFGVSAKRYVLYYLKNGKPVIQKASNHGLGHLKNPFPWKKDHKWFEEVWQDILNEHYGLITQEELREKYAHLYAISEFSLSTPELAKRLNALNRGKGYNERVKPFCFCLVGAAICVDSKTGKIVKPIAPFCKCPQEAVYRPFIDYNSGKVMQGEQYWKPLDDFLLAYETHPESKFNGDVGVLERRHIAVRSVALIGKESNNLERSRYFGIDKADLATYATVPVDVDCCVDAEDLESFIMSLKPSDAVRFDIETRDLCRWRAAIKKGEHPQFKGKSRLRLHRAINVLRDVNVSGLSRSKVGSGKSKRIGKR